MLHKCLLGFCASTGSLQVWSQNGSKEQLLTTSSLHVFKISPLTSVHNTKILSQLYLLLGFLQLCLHFHISHLRYKPEVTNSDITVNIATSDFTITPLKQKIAPHSNHLRGPVMVPMNLVTAQFCSKGVLADSALQCHPSLQCCPVWRFLNNQSNGGEKRRSS